MQSNHLGSGLVTTHMHCHPRDATPLLPGGLHAGDVYAYTYSMSCDHCTSHLQAMPFGVGGPVKGGQNMQNKSTCSQPHKDQNSKLIPNPCAARALPVPAHTATTGRHGVRQWKGQFRTGTSFHHGSW